MLVTFSGPDGVGKSTQLELLRNHANDWGWKCTTFWYRPGYSGELDALRRLVRRVRASAIPAPGASSKRRALFARPGVTEAWLGVAIADAVLQYGVRVRQMLVSNDLVICDRYSKDAVLDLELGFPDRPGFSAALDGLLTLVAPRPAIGFLLSVGDALLEERAELKREPFPDDVEVGRCRRERYRVLGASSEFTVVDASRSPHELHNEIWARIVCHPHAPSSRVRR